MQIPLIPAKAGNPGAGCKEAGRNELGPRLRGDERNVDGRQSPHNRVKRNRSALPITETELKLMAAAATIGLSNKPNAG
jgi:hypothetical protein